MGHTDDTAQSCVHIKYTKHGTQHPFQKQKRHTEQPQRTSLAATCLSTQGLIHTLRCTPCWTACGHCPLFPQRPRASGGQSWAMGYGLIKLSLSFHKGSNCRTQAQLIFRVPTQPTPHPARSKSKQALLKSTLGESLCPPMAGGSEFWSCNSFWCGWCPVTPSVGARHAAQTHAGLGYGAPKPASPEASGAGCAQQEQRSDLGGPPPPTWTWKCRLTVRMGRVA